MELRKKTLLEREGRPTFSHDGMFLATGGSNRRLAVWRVESGEMVKEFEFEGLRGSFSPRGTHLIIVKKTELELYAPPDFERPASVIPHPVGFADGVSLFRVSPDERIICLTSYSGEDPNAREAYWLDFLTFPDGVPLKTRFMVGNHPGPVSLNRGGDAVAVKSEGRIEIWDWRNEERGAVLQFPRVRFDDWAWVSPRPGSFAFSADGLWMATTHPDGTLRLTDLEEPARVKIFRFNPARGGGSFGFSPDGSLMAAVMGGEKERGQLLLYDLSTESVLLRREGRFGLGSQPTFSSDGRLLALGESLPYTMQSQTGKTLQRERPAVQVYELIRNEGTAPQ